jgi:hypothetical protein
MAVTVKPLGRVGKYTARGHHAHTAIGYLNSGNPLAHGGNWRGGSAPRARRSGGRRRSSY